MKLQLSRCPKVSSETGIRTVPPEETVRRAEPLLRRAGMDPVEDITGLDSTGIPVYAVFRRETAKGAPGSYNGKGATPAQAKASAAMEALERYSAEMRDTDEVVYGTVRQAAENGPTVDPCSLILPFPAAACASDATIAWTTGYDLFSGREVWVPACAVFYPYHPDGDMQLFRYHTNGIASGNTIEEAVLHGLFEVVERDAWSIAEYRGSANADVEADDPGSPAAALIRRFEASGVEIHLKDLTSDNGIPTIGAASDDVATKDPEMLDIGVGTHLDPGIAAVRALTEVAQSRATHRHGLKVNAELREATRRLGYDGVKAANRMWYGPSPSALRLSEMPNSSTPYVLDDIEEVLGRLAATGFGQAVVVDLTRPEIGVPTVRVVVPGMEVFAMDPGREGARAHGVWPGIGDEGTK